MNRGAALIGALLVTLASPATWPLALAAFLLRGGLLVVALPILVLPTPVGLGNLLAPSLTAFVFGGVTFELAAMVATIVLAVLAWLVAGGILAAILEAEAARIVAAHEEVAPPAGVVVHQLAVDELSGSGPARVARRRRTEAVRVFLARLVAHLPLGAVLVWGAVQVVAVTYRELTNPADVATPLVWRVLLASPEVVAAVVLTWMVGQAVGALAARRLVLARGGILQALRDASVTLVRRPVVVLADFWLPTLALALALAPSALAAASAGDVVREAMNAPDDPLQLLLAVLLFVSLWVVGLVLTAVICAWRAAVWTVGFGEAPR
ncbi:MAG TPA: hypothetical protein VIU37_00255 [Candidatus Limnocylindrales bacterium]|jgi:hypothetical protein